jgi:hypothetical protein
MGEDQRLESAGKNDVDFGFLPSLPMLRRRGNRTQQGNENVGRLKDLTPPIN